VAGASRGQAIRGPAAPELTRLRRCAGRPAAVLSW
jgi:hypothetical protein